MKHETINRLKANILKALFIIFALLSISLMYIVYSEQNKVLDNLKTNTQESLQKAVDYTFSETTSYYTTIAHKLIENLNISQYVINNDREGLYKVLKPKFDQLRQETPYFHAMHFIKANGNSFVRVHQKDKFGDPIINDRIMVQEIMKTKLTLVGYETGKYATVFRVLVPVFHKGEFLGSLGLGVEPNFIKEKIAQIIKLKGALFLKEDKLKLYKFENKFDLLISGYRIQTKLDKNSLEIIKSLPKDYNFKDDFFFKHNSSKYMFHTVNVKNFKDDIHGKFIFIDDMTTKVEELKNTQIYIVVILLLFLISAFITIRLFIIQFGNNLDKFYAKIISKIRKNENYLKAIEDNSSNMIISSSSDFQLIDGNRRFLEFTGYSTLSDYKKDHQCISDLFIDKRGYLHKYEDGQAWMDYIAQHPEITHKVVMKKGSSDRVFKVTTSKIYIDGKTFFVSTFADFTEIEEIRKRLSYAINGTKDGLWDWDLQTNEVYFSPRWKEMLGYEADELPNKLEIWDERVHPDDYQKAIDDIEANQNKETDTYENIHRLRHKDGSWVWILDRGQTIFDDNGKPIRMVGFHTDITKRKEEEKLIQLQALRAEALLEFPKLAEELPEREFMQKAQEIAEDLTDSNIAFIHFINDDEKTIELVTWSKRTLEHYCKMESYETHYPESQAGIWANSLRSKKPFIVNDYPNYPKKRGLPEGHAHLQRFVSVPVIEEGKVVMIAGVGNKKDYYDSLDIETLQLLSNDIWRTIQRRRNLEEIKQKDKMMVSQSRNAAMGEMISMIAHQWRQPLAVISMSANNVLADIELDMVEEDVLKESCKEIIYQTSELSKTIDDFKEFFKPVKKFELITPQEVLTSAFKVIGKSLDNNNIKVSENINSEKEIETYSRELMQVLLNILNNAKEVLIENNKAAPKQIDILIEDIENGVLVKICDNGGGIPEEIIDKVFEPYFSTKEERTGTGLGLYMSKIIIEKHLGGILEVKNQNEGACFSLELPSTLPKSSKKGK